MKYYFLATYLPEVHRDDKKLRYDLGDLLEDRGQMAPADRREIDLVLLGRDVILIEQILAGREPSVAYCLHDGDFWRDQIKSPQAGPEFLREYLASLVPGQFGPREVDRLYAAYYEYVLAVSKNDFLRRYIAFERDLRNVLAAARARKLGLPVAEQLVGASDIVEILGRSNAEDFGLGREFPWLEKMQAASEPWEMQDLVEQVLWSYLTDNTGQDPFAFSAILAYLLKLQLLERRLGMSEQAGMDLVRNLEGA